MKFSDLNWLFVSGVIGLAGCSNDRAPQPRPAEKPGKVNIDINDGVDVDVRGKNGERKVDVDVGNGKVNVDVK
jgi:hypothetical protein